MPGLSTLTTPACWGLAAIVVIAFATWLTSLYKRDVSIVDSVWGLLIFGAACAYTAALDEIGPRGLWILVLAAAWSARLSVYITWRNWGEEEDRRYQEIRKRNEPHFKWKSVYLVFGIQSALAWIVSLPLLAGLASEQAPNMLDALGIALCIFGLVFETVGDLQLVQFKSRPKNRNRVMDEGLWRYTRHPNYFGECCVWWGFYLIALAAGGWWAILSPLVMTILLLKVSGVTLLEKDLRERRPGYRDYIARTNAFFPGPPRA
jgi:steroid 5-alpha reductase family enzyme